jgi:hypothetical protein
MSMISTFGTKVKTFFTKLADKVEAGVNKIGMDLTDDWRHFYKMYSVWFFAAIGAAPDLYNLALSTGFLTGASAPAALDQIIKGIAFVGAASRVLKQKKLHVVQDQVSDIQSEKDLDKAEAELDKAEAEKKVIIPATPPTPVPPLTPPVVAAAPVVEEVIRQPLSQVQAEPPVPAAEAPVVTTTGAPSTTVWTDAVKHMGQIQHHHPIDPAA